MSSNLSTQDELAVVKEDLENLDHYTKGLRKSHKKLERLRGAYTFRRNIERDYAELDERHQRLEREYEAAWRRIKTMETEIASNKNDILALRTQVKIQQPLVQVGGDIRLRYLEQARECIFKGRKAHVQSPALKFGNQAAHSGNGQADAAVLALDAYTNKEKVALLKTFKELYHRTPQQFLLLPSKVQETINHEATTRTLRTRNTSLDRPLEQRQRALTHINVIFDKFAKLKRSKNIDEDPNVERRLLWIREDVAYIVETDRIILSDKTAK